MVLRPRVSRECFRSYETSALRFALYSAIVNARARQFRRPHRLARSRTSPFHGGNTGSNPVGVALLFSDVSQLQDYTDVWPAIGEG